MTSYYPHLEWFIECCHVVFVIRSFRQQRRCRAQREPEERPVVVSLSERGSRAVKNADVWLHLVGMFLQQFSTTSRQVPRVRGRREEATMWVDDAKAAAAEYAGKIWNVETQRHI